MDQAIADLSAVGIKNWSLDLISGLPHQTLDIWRMSLQTAIAQEPAHISVYDLTVEPGTVFEHRYRPGAAPLPTDEATTAMYRLTQATLTAAGYEHYEISNYARPGYDCHHNRVYWENRPYYGFGMGATSYTQYQRFSRPRTTDTYRQWVDAYVVGDGQLDCNPTPPKEQWLDQLMVGLRLREGIDLRALATTYGTAVVAELQTLLAPEVHKGWVVIDTMPSPRLRLTDPEGFLFSNQVLVKLFDRWGN